MILESKWIAYPTGAYQGPDAKYGTPSPYFRKTFSLSGEVLRGTVLFSAIGVGKIYVNGTPAGDEYLAPGWVDYGKKLPLVSWDVTALLRENNAVGVVLGDGWGVGHLGSHYTFKRCNYGLDRPEFTLTLRVEYADGRKEEIITDETWKASRGEILRSDIYMGEVVDHRVSLGDFSAPDYDDSAWDTAEVPPFKFSRNLFLEALDLPPVRVMHPFSPRKISENAGTVLYDVGQNIAGVMHLTLRGSRGSRVTVRHGEMLKDGLLYTENLRKAEATDTYILSGEGVETFRPLFTYHGFQYAELSLEGEVEICSVTAEAMYTDLPEAGRFSCSDPLVNKIFENTLWGQRDNFMSVPTDCPQRDERLGWTGDSQVFCQTAMYNMDCSRYYKKYLADIRDAQLGNGVIPAVAPLPRVGSYAYTGRDCAAGWSEAIGEIAYTHYKMYGDKSVLRQNLPALKRLLDYYRAESGDGLRQGGNMYGDWLSVGTPSDRDVIANLYYARAAWLAETLCRRTGDEEAPGYQALYDRIRQQFRAEYLDESGKIRSDTQSVYVIAYQFGLISGDEAKVQLERKLKEDDGHLTTGFLGVKYLLPTLCDLGLTAQAYRILTRREYPGWGYSIENGATTIWEHWDSYTKEKGFLPGMNSFNHYSLGACVEWMYEYCLGIRPDAGAGGFRRLRMMPYFDPTGAIASAKGSYETPYGTLWAEWTKEGETVHYTVTLPAQPETEFSFPNGEVLFHRQQGTTHVFQLKIREE